MSKGLWGADTTDERKPTWPWVSEYIGYANCFATGGGWTVRWPWGDEVIVALSNLTDKLGTTTETGLQLGTIGGAYAVLANIANEGVQVWVTFNEGVTITGTPTLEVISVAGEANITLSYNAVSSNLQTGKVVFSNQNFTLGTAGYAYDNLVINSTSTVTGWDGIKDAGSANVVANGIPDALSLTIPVYQEKPVHVATAPTTNNAADTTDQRIGFILDFNDVVQVTGIPYIIAIGPNTDIANVQLNYYAPQSNLAAGQLFFQSDVLDFSDLTGNCEFTLTTNGASTNATDGWSGITGPLPIEKVVVHGIAVANTITVTQHEPFLAATLAGANVTNSTAQTVTFTIGFDRDVLVNTSIATPTVRAISNHASFANATLTYAAGSGSSNLTFSAANLDLSTAANGAYHVNSTSVITGFNAISNTGVASDLTGVLTGADANAVLVVSA